MSPFAPESAAAALVHVRAPVPLRFPESAEMPEGYDHLILRTFLFQLLQHALGPAHTVGSEQFVYWMPTNPRRCVSPDVFVKPGVPQASFGSWKCWERGAPALAVEIVSPTENDGVDWDEKLARYAELGVAELVRFDPEAASGERLRVWDRVAGDFVERVVSGDGTPCVTLGLHWVVSPVLTVQVGLRLAGSDGALVPTREEADASGRAASEAARVAADDRARVEAASRVTAEARVRELEELLAKASRG